MNYWVTPIRLQAEDFPGQVLLFTNLKVPIKFRNETLEFISRGGWAELPTDHYNAFVKALEEGWVQGERGWHLNTDSFTRKWSTPSWVSEELAKADSIKMSSYIARSKLLLTKGVVRPFVNRPSDIPPALLLFMVERLEQSKVQGNGDDYYRMISGNLESRPDREVAHRAFNLLFPQINSRYVQVDIIQDLSKINPEDRKSFMSYLFESPNRLKELMNTHWGLGEIVLDAVKSGEVWYVGDANEKQKPVPEATCDQESATTLLGCA